MHLDSGTMNIILGAALAISEGLALIPGVKSSGIMDLVLNFLKKISFKG
jgi:hypothetical protein